MKQTLLLVLLSLCCLSLTFYADACHRDGPGYCTVLDRRNVPCNHVADCSWSSETTETSRGLIDYLLRFLFGLDPNAVDREMTSRQICSTGGQAHCLSFRYKFEENDAVNLTVSIKYEGANHAQTLLEVVASNYGWNNASVDINTTSNFNLVFTASPGSSDNVTVDDISYWKSPCQSGLSRPSPTPTTNATSTVLITTSTTNTTPRASTIKTATQPPSSPTATTTTTTATTASTKVDTTAGITSENSKARTLAYHSGSTKAATTPTIHRSDQDKPVPPSNRAGIIAGVTVAALIVIVIAVLLVVFRQKYLQVWKKFFGSNKQTEGFQMNASHNAACGLDADEPSHALTHRAPQNSKSNRMEAAASTDSTGEYRVAKNKEPVYAKVNKPKSNSQETPLEGQQNGDTAVYKVSDENEMRSSTCPAPDSKGHPLTAQKPGQDGHECSSTSRFRVTGHPQEENRVYHILEKIPETESDNVYHVPQGDATTMPQEHDGEYNRLDFDMKSGVDGKCRVAAIGSDEEKSERSTDGVYSHLNEGGEDTYNEVHWHVRKEVIDGVYSHIK